MSGLLKNNFYGAIGNVKLFIAFDALLAIALFISGSPSLLNIFSIITPPAMALLAIACLRKEESSKWAKYKLSFPVLRKDIVKSQFISHMFFTAGGVLIVSITILLTVLIHGNRFFYYGFRDALTLILSGGVIAALLGAFAYPMFYMWGAERIEASLAISLVASVGVVFGLTSLVNLIFGSNVVSDFEYYMSLAVILIISVILYFISYFVTAGIFAKKEY